MADTAYRLYMMILDCPGITRWQLSRALKRKSAGWVDSALIRVEERYGLLTEDDSGGLYVWKA